MLARRLASLAALAAVTACAGRNAPTGSIWDGAAAPESPRLEPARPTDRATATQWLLVPVVGVRATEIPDSFSAPRSGDRTHNALDILAPRGTPVLSADDGMVLRLSENRLGGLTIYATDPQDRFVYYYAHLDRYADGLAQGQRLAKGDTIGFVGTTGNAPDHIPHLHFQMMRKHPAGRYWDGEPVDPRPYFLPDREARQ